MAQVYIDGKPAFECENVTIEKIEPPYMEIDDKIIPLQKELKVEISLEPGTADKIFYKFHEDRLRWAANTPIQKHVDYTLQRVAERFGIWTKDGE